MYPGVGYTTHLTQTTPNTYHCSISLFNWNVLRPLGEAMGMFMRTLLVLVIATAVIEDGARRNIRRERRGGGFGGGVNVADNSEGHNREVRDLRDAAELQGRGGASKIRGKRSSSSSSSGSGAY
ncbi:uncharacterized protein LOC144928777 [Branchiostoma floridae x Branchiostoma belcheri]